MDIHVFHHYPDVEDKLDDMLVLLRQLIRKEERIMATQADVQAEVEKVVAVETAALAELQKLAASQADLTQQLKDALVANDPAAADKAIADLEATNAPLQAALAALNPAPAPEPPATP